MSIIFEDDEVLLISGVSTDYLKKNILEILKEQCLDHKGIKNVLEKKGVFVSENRLRIAIAILVEEEKIFYDFIRGCFRTIHAI